MLNQVDNDIAVLAILGEFLSTPAMSLVPLRRTATGRPLGTASAGLRGNLGAGSVSISFMLLETVFSNLLSPDNPQRGIADAVIY